MRVLASSMIGRLQTPEKLIQLSRVLNALKEFNHDLTPKSVINQTSWISGMFDADGSVNCNQKTLQLSLSITQKNRYILDLIVSYLGVGNVYYDKTWDGYIYYATSKEDLDVILNYFAKYPSRVPPKYPSRVPPKNQDLETLKLLKDYKSKGMHLPSHSQHRDFLTLSKKLINRQLPTENHKV